MIVTIEHKDHTFKADLSKPLDISLPLGGARCFYAPEHHVEPFTSGDFVGSVAAGASVNFYNVFLNPHGNGTHTECIGHITEQRESVNDCLTQYHFIAQLITLPLVAMENGDLVITEALLDGHIKDDIDALIIRTNIDKRDPQDYSGTNPPYLTEDAMKVIVNGGVEHLLVDLPSVDREQDGGALLSHRCFWQFEGDRRLQCTITELIGVSEKIRDDLYLMNIQTIPINLDASPSRIVLYELKEV